MKLWKEFLNYFWRLIESMDDNFVTKDSGTREAFDTGARRDVRAGKGRFDLIPPQPIKRLAGIYERGAQKYGDNNWLKGMPWSRVLDSAKRHLNQWELAKKTGVPMDEDHLGQAIWNLFALCTYEYIHPELDDVQGQMIVAKDEAALTKEE